MSKMIEPFTEAEMLERGEKLAKICSKMKRAEDTKKKISNRMNQQLRELTKERDTVIAEMMAGGLSVNGDPNQKPLFEKIDGAAGTCPHCQAKVEEGADICLHCGNPVAA